MHFFQLISVFLLIQQYRAQVFADSANCEVKGITENEWGKLKEFAVPIDDTKTDAIFEGEYKNIKGIGPCATYFCLQLDEEKKIFRIVPSSNFFNIDGGGEFHRTNSPVKIISTIPVDCTSGSTSLTFLIYVNDTNNHAPTFSLKEYSYNLPMPMSPKNNITNFGTEIIVQDVDFSNKNVTFSYDFKGLIGAVTLLDNYSYQLQFQFSAMEKLKSTESFIVTATDWGTPPRNSTAKVIFNIDESSSEPPAFTKPSYLFDYDPKTNSIVARENQDIKLESEWKGLICSIREDKYSPFFNDVDVNGVNIKLSLKKPFTEDIMAGIITQITLECYVSKTIGISSADVIISFPQNTEETVQFSEKKYNATYVVDGNKHEIKMTKRITLTGKEDDVAITVEEDLGEYLQVNKADDGWSLALKKDLDKSLLKTTALNVVIQLARKNIKKPIDEAFINLLLPNGEEGVYFKEPFFSGDYEYDENDDGTMEPISITLNSNDVDVVNCGLGSSKYTEYFSLTCTTADKLELRSGKQLPKDLLKPELVPLSMWVNFKLGNIERNLSTAVLLSLTYKETSPSSSSSTSSSSTPSTTTTTEATPTSDDCSHTAWIIAVIILLLLLIAYIVATLLYYFKRIRNRNEVDYVPKPSKITPKYNSRPSDDRFKDVSTRRPTGFIRYNPDQDRSSQDSGDTEEVNNNTNANKFVMDSDESSRKSSNGMNGNGRSIGFIIPPPPPEPITLNDELKRALEERENRLSR